MMFINSRAPIRICDNGGWTDTWFARYGQIFNIAVAPYVEVQIKATPASAGATQATIQAENFGDPYSWVPGSSWDRHPLIEAAIQSMDIPAGLALEINLFSEAPSGASTGTSAAVTVALLGALDCLTPGRMTRHEIALAAQRVETELLGQQCGIQDQLASAYGGINFIDMDDYPHAAVQSIRLPGPLEWELESRLALVYLGRAHSSSAVHELVLRELEAAGPECRQLADLRGTARKSYAALLSGDFPAFGAALQENTAAQQRLHPALISPAAERIIEIARAHGALGWKVNGAGGQGGSLTLLGSESAQARRAMLREIEAEDPLFRRIPIHLDRDGLRVW
jgi:D-glycero-alpha-D-manno-heptose-7-phosphate kinase